MFLSGIKSKVHEAAENVKKSLFILFDIILCWAFLGLHKMVHMVKYDSDFNL